MTNCIIHGYKCCGGTIHIYAAVYDNGKVVIKVKDKGCGIENVKQAMEPMFTTDTQNERAGLGFAVMQAFMDKVKVFSNPGKGTRVVMTKIISK